MEKIRNNKTLRYEYIDVLRGLAALMVVYQHTSEIFLNPGLQINFIEGTIIAFFSKTIGLGEVGVCLFLMISGFVVPFSLFKYDSNPIRNFAAHRFFRLYPAYWLSIPLGLMCVPWQGGEESIWATTLANLSMLQDFVGYPDIMGQYWTLSLELVFYVLCAALFYWKRLNSFKHILLLLIFFILFREAARHLPFISGFAFGKITSFRYLAYMFFGLLYRQWLIGGYKKAAWQAALIVAFALISFGTVNDFRHFFSGDHFDSTGNFALKTPLTHLTAIAIFVFCTHVYRPSNVIGTFLGKISYSIYLFHPIIFYPLYSHWFQYSSMISHPHIFILAAMSLTILISSMTYQFLEKPCVDFGRRRFAGKFA
jgi:peptidoglycan/LPS O-acetylase OafA/YrhL